MRYFAMKTLYLVIFSLLLSLPIAAQPGQPAAGKGYLFSPGDEILVKVIGEEQFGFSATVDADGRLATPYSKELIAASCLSETELRGLIALQLGKYLKEPQLVLNVTKRTVVPVTVWGEVMKPDQYELRRKATLIELMAHSGGPKEGASGEIDIFRPLKPPCGDDANTWRSDPNKPGEIVSRTFSLSDMAKGGEEFNPTIYPGDVIFVKAARPVYVTGEVIVPQGIYLKEGGLTLTEAIAKVGGLRPQAKTKDIQIQRRGSNPADVEFISVNYDLIRKRQQPDVVLQPHDIVLVDVKKDSMGVTFAKFMMGMARTGASALSTGTGYRVIQ
jgi:polysaccharide biosynthesis/export protein